ncbi:hypothetical protein KFD70_19175 [Bacillus pfraonensis]|uniref:hypothetical protein n=1 Tax=Bacillus TaxID=1386 RepID=UPI003012F84F
MNQDNLLSNLKRYETSNSNPLAFLDENKKSETAATDLNSNENPLAFLTNDHEIATNKTYKDNPLIFLESAGTITDELLTEFKYQGIVEVLRKYQKGIKLEQDELKLLLDFRAMFPTKTLEQLED